MKLSSSSPSSPSSACTPSFPTRTSRGCRRRRVSFSLTEAKSKCNNVSSSSSSSSCCNNTQNQKDDCCDPSQCWYTESELEAIKMEIRQCACRLFHSGHYRPGDVTFQSEPSQEAATTAANEKDALSLSATTTTTASAFVCWRGLELKLSPERQQNRLLTIRAIVKAQSRFQNPDMLAFVAHKCSMWANQIAVQAANRDYHDVYEKKTGDGAAAVVESDKEEKEEEDDNPLALPVVEAPNLLRTFRKRILYHQQHQEQQRQQQDDVDDDDQNQRRVRQCTRPEVFV